MCSAGGFGSAPLSFQEIEAWQRTTGVTITPWETLVLRRLSMEYVAGLAKSKDRTMISPWAGQDIEEKRRIVDQTLRDLARQHKDHDRHRNA
jgi:hypothetical protein